MARYDYDLFVIGAGSGGVRAARVSANYGARVAIAEEYRVGGTCVIRGCVPKKLLVYAAHVREEIEDAEGYGWTIPEAKFDWATLIANKDAEIDRLESVYRRMLDKLTGVRVVIIGIPPVDEGLFTVNRARLISNAKIEQINAQLAHLCSQYSNCKTATAAMQFNMADKTLDGIHLKPETYAAWTSVLAQYLADPTIPAVDPQR